MEQRPGPQINAQSEAYWQSVTQHAMVLQRCERCSTFRFYPTPVCPKCWFTGFSWEQVSGEGELYSFTIVHKPVNDAFAGNAPYVIALVTLAEGPTMMMNLEDVDLEALQIGMPLKLGYLDFEGFTLPVARPV